MALNPSIGLAGIALQKGRGQVAKTPAFLHGLTGGSPFGVSRSIANTAVACGNRAPSDARVDKIEITPSIQSLCYPDVFGLYLYLALGNVTSAACEETNLNGYYKHVFTMGADIPYATIWSQIGVDNFTRSDDCKLSTLELTATGNEHLAMKADFHGCGASFLSAIPGNLEASCFNGKYTTTDCDFKLDTASDTPAEALVSEASFTIENNVTDLSGLGRSMPRDVAEGNCNVGVSVTTIPDNILEYRKMVAGSAAATGVSSKVVLGSVYSKFNHTDDAKMTLEIAVNHIPFTADFPEVDPEGNEATIQFTSDAAIIKTASESPVTITLINKTASYTA